MELPPPRWTPPLGNAFGVRGLGEVSRAAVHTQHRRARRCFWCESALRRHALLVHAAAQCFDVVADVGDHAVPLVALGRFGALVRGGAASARPVAVGGGVRGRAGGAPVAAEAVRDDAPAVLHADRLQEILKVLAVLLGDEGTQACRGEQISRR